jgi:hypothetical protein
MTLFQACWVGMLIGAAGGISYTIGYCVGVSRETKRWKDAFYPPNAMGMKQGNVRPANGAGA